MGEHRALGGERLRPVGCDSGVGAWAGDLIEVDLGGGGCGTSSAGRESSSQKGTPPLEQAHPNGAGIVTGMPALAGMHQQPACICKKTDNTDADTGTGTGNHTHTGLLSGTLSRSVLLKVNFGAVALSACVSMEERTL